jgi:hypothetical protein
MAAIYMIRLVKIINKRKVVNATSSFFWSCGFLLCGIVKLHITQAHIGEGCGV